MRLPLLLALSGLLVAGCGDDSSSKVVAAGSTTTQRLAWIGTFPDSTGQGDIVLDISQTGPTLTGEVVFGPTGASHFWVSGTSQSDSLFLAPDPAHTPVPIDFYLRAKVLPNGSLSGRMEYPLVGLSTDLSCRPLTRRNLDTDAAQAVPYDVIAIVYDGSYLWLSTTSTDYVRMTPGGAIVDTIAIDHAPAATWTSSVLMYDGALIWGEYPITLMGPGGTLTNVADLLAFTASGRAPDSLRIESRSHGLAYDGAHSWSLLGEPAALIQFDGTGAVTDSLHLGVPDASQLAYYGGRFWTVGWYMRRLYEVDLTGEVVSVCDLPATSVWTFASGLTIEGSHFWYAEGTGGTSTLHRMTIR